ncbi:RFX1 factor, partial [Alcedo cyanopectus]|nr:RFX1 factor [Ceyx cyanopectus]
PPFSTPPPPKVLPPVQHVYPYVEGGDGSYPPGTIRSGSYPFAETPLYAPNSGPSYYEAAAGGGPVQPSPPP